MRTFTLLAITGIGLCTAPVVNAQKTQSPWTFGVKAGINAAGANVSNNYPLESISGIAGFNGGVTAEYALRNRFFLSSGLEFTTKGFDSQRVNSLLDEPYSFSKESRRLKYLQVPLTIGYRLPVSKNVNLTFNAGGYFAYGVAAKGRNQTWTEVSTEEGYSSYAYTEAESTKAGDTDYGLLFGAGIEYKRFSFNFNYELGLRNLHTGSASSAIGDTGFKNRNAAFSVGYKF